LIFIISFLVLIYSYKSLNFIEYTSFKFYFLFFSKLNLSYYIYYINFKLIFYFNYKYIILYNYIKGYILKHFSNYKEKAKANKAISLIIIFLRLEIKFISKSLELIIKFQTNINSFFKF
jgi:hypothetical protein